MSSADEADRAGFGLVGKLWAINISGMVLVRIGIAIIIRSTLGLGLIALPKHGPHARKSNWLEEKGLKSSEMAVKGKGATTSKRGTLEQQHSTHPLALA